MPTNAQLVDWRYQCVERLARWKQGRYTPEWHLDVQETLSLLDMVRDLQGEVERLRMGLDTLLDRCEEGGEPAGPGIDPEYADDQVLIRKAYALRGEGSS